MNLTDEEIRIQVAEAMGWHEEKEPVGSANASAWWHNNDRYPSYLMPVPNYPADLNACAEFEKSLTEEEHLRYRVRLWNVVITEGDETTWDRQFISATARQRCLAYLKTKELIP